ncbi:MAG TPA: nuclear transport factor 2 family protein [Streptomyces sp.]
MSTDVPQPAGNAAARAHAETARAFFRLLSAKDITAWGELWHPDAVLSVPYPADGFPTEIRGKEQIASGFHGLFAHFDTFTAHLTGVYPSADSDAVCVEYRNAATLVGGTAYTNDNIAVFRFRDGLISEYHDYFDPRRFQVVVDALAAG